MKYIIKVNCLVKSDTLHKIKEYILQQLNTEGIVVLDSSFEVLAISEDTDMTVEAEDEVKET